LDALRSTTNNVSIEQTFDEGMDIEKVNLFGSLEWPFNIEF
jgi:hypothetical protein